MSGPQHPDDILSDAAASQAPLVQHLLSISKTVRQLHGLALGALPIMPGQDQLLLVLAKHGSVPSVKIVSELQVRASTVSKMIDHCERHGWVRRIGDDTDHRRTILSLTSEGATIALQVQKAIGDFEADLKRHLPADPETGHALKKMADTLSKRLSRLR